jgi:hypothetical protein
MSPQVTVSIAKSAAARIPADTASTAADTQQQQQQAVVEANGSTAGGPASSPAKESTQLLQEKRENRTLHFVIKAPPKASFIKMIHKAGE